MGLYTMQYPILRLAKIKDYYQLANAESPSNPQSLKVARLSNQAEPSITGIKDRHRRGSPLQVQGRQPQESKVPSNST